MDEPTTTTDLAKLVTEASDEKLLLLRIHGRPETVRAAQREIVKRLGQRLRDQPPTFHSDRLGAVTIPEE